MLNKLNRYHVIIIGVVLCIGIAGFFMMVPIKNKKAEIAAQQALLDQYTQKAAELPQAEAELRKANQDLKDQEMRLARYMKTRMPDISLTDRVQGMISYWRECSDIMGPTIERFLLSRPGVTGVSGLSIKGPSTNPNDMVTPNQRFDIPLGNISVRINDYRNVMKFFKQMRNCPRLVYINSVQLAGPPSPDLTLTLGMTAYIFPTGAENSTPITEAGTSAGGEGGAGGGVPMAGGMMPGAPGAGGPPGMAPGGPPGMAPGGPPMP